MSCVFGFDFGTQSCRLVAMDLADGTILGVLEEEYPHGVISERLYHKPIPLGPDWYLQDPEDWLGVLCSLSRRMILECGIDPAEVVAIGSDFTDCTLLPIDKDGVPLCTLPQWRDVPNAWPKLWKHHGAQCYAERIEAYAKANTTWLKDYFGNSVSSEWVYPKVMQVAVEDPEVYRAADYFIEAVNWIPLLLSGCLTRSSASLGVNSFWIKGKGYPDREFIRAIEPLMEDVAQTKLAGDVVTVGDPVGFLTERMAARMGLCPGTIIAAGHSDGAVSGCGAGVVSSGSMMLVMGTSTCHQMMYDGYRSFDGICSVASDGMVPGLYGYESGQSATGDVFSWFAKTCTPPAYVEEAERRGMSLLAFLDELADGLRPGQSGLIALDWLNGNRSILSNYNLSGMIAGLTLSTKPEEIYRALVEANLFGSRRILDHYDAHGVTVNRVYAVGGLAMKSPFVMRTLADITGRDIIVPLVDNVSARGAAVCAAVAAGVERGGCADFSEAAERLIPKDKTVYAPDPERHRTYQALYSLYLRLHDQYGISDPLMKELRELRSKA